MILSSFTDGPPKYFEGYCFSGTDYVAEEDGHRAYVSSGGSVPPGLDGCYAVIRKTDAGVEFGTDARGLRRLFVYQNGAQWAVGSSLYELADHLRSCGVDLQPCLPVLRAFGVRKSLTAQLSTLQTIFQDITLVPSYCVVRVEHDVVSVVPRAEPADRVPYEQDLQVYIETWLSRFQTLYQHPDSQFTIDLSGGLDSRLVFAFVLASGALELPRGRIRVVSQVNLLDDYIAAQAIADKHGVTLNHPRGEIVRGRSSIETATASWKDTCLGLYLPLYVNPHQFDALSIKGHGAGGGTFRDIYTDATLGRRLESLSGEMPKRLYDEYRDLADSALRKMANERPGVDVGKLLYREYRNRFHFGHAPQRRPAYSPVNSILTDRLGDRPGFEPKNIYYDALDCLVPGLKNEAYDHISKMPAASEPSAASRRVHDLQISPGSVYAPEVLPPTKPASTRAALRELHLTAREVLQDDGVQDLIGDRTVIGRCEEALEHVLSAEKPLRANDPDNQDVSFVLATAFAAGVLL